MPVCRYKWFNLGFVIGAAITIIVIVLSMSIMGYIYLPRSTINTTIQGSAHETSHFSQSYYNVFLSELKKPKYLVLNVSGFIRLLEEGGLPKDRVIVILRHDVDYNPARAKEISLIEKNHNITSTYYIRTRGDYNPLSVELYNWLNWLNNNGFEVGLHYEELYYTNYSFIEAVELFSEDLELLRTMSPVVTVCSHGNSKNQVHINYEIFSANYTTLKEHGLIGEAYLSILNTKYNLNIEYFSDSNGKWEDWLEKLYNANDGDVIYFTFHPEYWYRR